MGTCVSYIDALCAPQTRSEADLNVCETVRPPKNRAVIYSRGVAAVYTTPLQSQQLLPWHDTSALYHPGNCHPPPLPQHPDVNGIIAGHRMASDGITHFYRWQYRTTNVRRSANKNDSGTCYSSVTHWTQRKELLKLI